MIFFLQKIAVLEMILRTVKQLFKIHMQSGKSVVALLVMIYSCCSKSLAEHYNNQSFFL